jgi:asparagine synthase (glutamine-hydrolysing)
MCGITGIFNYADAARPIDRALLERMTSAVAHRGPDAEGFHVEGPVGLGHRRLSIVDLTPTGAQPMSDESGRCWLVYNGEFYNHAQFRPALATRHTFRGPSDTETLLTLLVEKGPNALAGTAAIFGLAFWDGRRRALTLARDPLGVKQVYYYDDGERVLFASEIKALLACPEVPRELDAEGLNQYLHFHTPLFDRTFFRHVRQLKPGEHLTFTRDGPKAVTYWKVDDFQRAEGDPEERVRELRDALARVVSDQLMSDVPVGAFFSGGIDSSAVAAFAKLAGYAPRCFGVHFEDQGVIDERPFQEAAARALGLDLELVTLDGKSFPDDFLKLLYFQDEPVIGAAMLPMYAVSRLASQKVKVCLGGQAADEIFGGYARYALARPASVLRSWFPRGGAAAPSSEPALSLPRVGGNLRRQLFERRTLWRLVQNARNLADWRALYFDNFAKVPEADWRELVAADGVVSRESCRELFRETLARSPATDPGDKVMHWDLQTYLPGLFHQDDRMSMANSLESRVPLADPRLVAFAFRCGFDLKFKAGASKWILRQAVSDAIPAQVLTRRKVGFDTPAETWMRGAHHDFVRDTLLSRRARERGLWNPRAIARLLERTNRSPLWFDLAWKVLCVESWAQLFLDQSEIPARREKPAAVAFEPREEERASSELARAKLAAAPAALRDAAQELFELGLDATLFRVSWEARLRSGLMPLFERARPEAPRHLLEPIRSAEGRSSSGPLVRGLEPNRPAEGRSSSGPLVRGLEPNRPAEGRSSSGPLVRGLERPALPSPGAVASAVRERIAPERLEGLVRTARNAARGRIVCFGRWPADFGDPIDWHLNPVSGRRWDPSLHWSKVLQGEPRVGDVKFTWEVGRFPQAYQLARAAAFFPELRADFARALATQIVSFVQENPFRLGVHWCSGQEVALRMMAWHFAWRVLGDEPSMQAIAPLLTQALDESAAHVEEHRAYAAKAVHNNHLIAEALAGLVAAVALPQASEAGRRRREALAILDAQADEQFYEDGAYIQQSHNYQRTAMQLYLAAAYFQWQRGERVPEPWRLALERSLSFLLAHQNPVDGGLPNFGANDGSMPLLLASSDFTSYRPTLQAASLLTRGERLYEPGPWDEAAAWLLGPDALEAPLARPAHRSVSFAATGYHVLRAADPSSFCTLRCGTLRDRFSQIDMLHVDVFWRGQNVLVDPGSYRYNGADRWHDHFLQTASHNTVMIDGRDQMLHYRRFKNLYRPRAQLLRFEAQEDWSLCEGEHEGYLRHPGRCVHRRSVLLAGDGLFVVVDHLLGEGEHLVRLHWLGGELPFRHDEGRLELSTPKGPFSVSVYDRAGRPLPSTVVAGRASPPRGWLSRYYGEKVAVPSMVVEARLAFPCTLVSVLAAGAPQIRVAGERWRVTTDGVEAELEIRGGRLVPISAAKRVEVAA